MSRYYLLVDTPGSANNFTEVPDHDLALTVLEKVSTYEERLGKGDARLPSEDVEACAALVAEYYILRTIVVCTSFPLGVSF